MKLTLSEQMYRAGALAGLIFNHPGLHFEVWIRQPSGRRGVRKVPNALTAHAWANYFRRNPQKGVEVLSLRADLKSSPEVQEAIRQLDVELEAEFRAKRKEKRQKSKTNP